MSLTVSTESGETHLIKKRIREILRKLEKGRGYRVWTFSRRAGLVLGSFDVEGSVCFVLPLAQKKMRFLKDVPPQKGKEEKKDKI